MVTTFKIRKPGLYWFLLSALFLGIAYAISRIFNVNFGVCWVIACAAMVALDVCMEHWKF